MHRRQFHIGDLVGGTLDTAVPPGNDPGAWRGYPSQAVDATGGTGTTSRLWTKRGAA